MERLVGPSSDVGQEAEMSSESSGDPIESSCRATPRQLSSAGLIRPVFGEAKGGEAGGVAARDLSSAAGSGDAGSGEDVSCWG